MGFEELKFVGQRYWVKETEMGFEELKFVEQR